MNETCPKGYISHQRATTFMRFMLVVSGPTADSSPAWFQLAWIGDIHRASICPADR
jgi:hypothetical protein